jgi:hypothetical protein
VTGPDGLSRRIRQIDVGPAKWTGRGIDFSGPAKDQLGYDPTDKSFTYSLVDDRNKIDRAQTGYGTVGGKVSAAVEFLNVPLTFALPAKRRGTSSRTFKSIGRNRRGSIDPIVSRTSDFDQNASSSMPISCGSIDQNGPVAPLIVALPRSLPCISSASTDLRPS